mgnify:CR=1 FL=1
MDSNKIAGFFLNGWYVFDNFAAFQIKWHGKLYPTSEHAYQAAHFIDTNPELAEEVRTCRSPRAASDLANKNIQYDDPEWNSKRLQVMEEIIRCKVGQHVYIQKILVESGSKIIVEMNDGDSFWGWGKDHKGENQLGNIWMKVREDLITN